MARSFLSENRLFIRTGISDIVMQLERQVTRHWWMAIRGRGERRQAAAPVHKDKYYWALAIEESASFSVCDDGESLREPLIAMEPAGTTHVCWEIDATRCCKSHTLIYYFLGPVLDWQLMVISIISPGRLSIILIKARILLSEQIMVIGS